MGNPIYKIVINKGAPEWSSGLMHQYYIKEEQENAAPGLSQRIAYIFRLSTYALDCGKNYFWKVI